ncbi:hypothetical protein [Actinoplanes regularis]|nr:hypothetical protein [Actinoplanes regularis]
MKVTEIPAWRWGERFDPRLVRAVVDAADATNDLALALAEASLQEQQANTRLERLSREGDTAAAPRRRAAAEAWYDEAGEFAERVAALYAREALRFAFLTAGLLTRLKAGADPTALAPEVPDGLQPSQLYRDPSLLPPPPIEDEDGVAAVNELSLALTYTDIMAAVRLVSATSERVDALDAGAEADETSSVWGTGGVDLAQALHRYGHLCLWRLAGLRPETWPTP